MRAYEFLTKKYRAPRIPGELIVFLVVSFAVLSLVRGISYAASASTPGDSYVVIRATIGGLEMWGAFLAFGSLVLLTSIAVRLHAFIWFGHVWLTAVYLCFSVTTLQAALYYSGGFQAAVPFVGGLLWHGLFAYLMRPTAAKETE